MRFTAFVYIHYKTNLLIEKFSIEHENIYEFEQTMKFHFDESYDPEHSSPLIVLENYFDASQDEFEIIDYTII